MYLSSLDAISAEKMQLAAVPFQIWEISSPEVCPNPPHFYKIKGLLPALRRRKQVPSEGLIEESSL